MWCAEAALCCSPCSAMQSSNLPGAQGTSFPSATAHAWIYWINLQKWSVRNLLRDVYAFLQHILSSCSVQHMVPICGSIWDGSHCPVQQSGVTVVYMEISVLPAFSWLTVKRSVCVSRVSGCCFPVLSLKRTPLYGHFRNFFSLCTYIWESFQPGTIKLDSKC